MTIKILELSQQSNWSEFLDDLPEKLHDVYFTPQYHKLHEYNGEGEARVFVFQKDGGLFFYPFLLREISEVAGVKITEEYKDITSCYGYGGPIAFTSNGKFIKKANKHFRDYCREQNIIAEFIRFHPLLENHKFVSSDVKVEEDSPTVAMELTQSKSKIWKSYSSENRNMIRKAGKRGICIQNSRGKGSYKAFKNLYFETMERVNADEYYYFSEKYFSELFKLIQNNGMIFTANKEGSVIAASIMLRGSKYLHYHLSGADVDYRSDAPNNKLLHNAALWGKDRGLKAFHLGGGNSSSKDDSLFRFKENFSKNYKTFRIGKRVHNKNVYENLVSIWNNKHSKFAKEKDFFLKYRLGE